ncbi:MAG: mevalonate diphosphate decarboxylase [Gammaproteobacteria bacterium]|jgi:diphosphomevalonate decarboxylase|nr:mevalonate diphosphate decarboxylase [Gammaproteobacteria bacterium]
MKWQAQAPANLALIKYMGKTNHTQNIATNPSLSYTLSHLKTTVEIESHGALSDQWELLQQKDLLPMTLSEQGINRFLAHLSRLKAIFGYSGSLCVRSANNFPADCGLASSASSFAALTLCANNALSDLTQQKPLALKQLITLSREASGSSCRSFFEAWCIWDGDEVNAIPSLEKPHPYQALIHQVVIITQSKKAVTSSEAHQRVTSSLLFEGRVKRANLRQLALLEALIQQQWRCAYEITFEEFWDMHALFATAKPPFLYMSEGSLAVLQAIQDYWVNQGDGPIVTLDAGPNVHLLWRRDQSDMANTFFYRMQKRGFHVIGY